MLASLTCVVVCHCACCRSLCIGYLAVRTRALCTPRCHYTTSNAVSRLAGEGSIDNIPLIYEGSVQSCLGSNISLIHLSIQSTESTDSKELVPERLYSQINIKVFESSWARGSSLKGHLLNVEIKMFDASLFPSEAIV